MASNFVVCHSPGVFLFPPDINQINNNNNNNNSSIVVERYLDVVHW
jgi:hypothetical protein